MEALLSLLVFLAFLVPVLIAQFAHRHRWAMYATFALLLTIDLFLLGGAGLALLSQLVFALSPDQVPSEASVVGWWVVALASLLTAVLAALVLIPAVRRWLARWLPIDAGSMIHMTALAYAVYLIGLSLGQMALIGNLENLTEFGLSLSILDVLLTGLPMLLYAVVGVGAFIRRDSQSTLERLGLRLPTGRHILLAAGLIVLLLAFDFAVNVAWQAVDPSGYDLLVRVTDSIFGDLMTVGGAIVLGLSAGISEELLFRGAVQPRLGLVLAAALFTVGHLQYGITVASLEVFVIGLVLGLVRNRTNTTVTILIHAGYNTTGVLLGLLQP